MAEQANTFYDMIGKISTATGKVLAIVINLLPASAALLITMYLIAQADLRFSGLTDQQTLSSLALIALFSLAGLAVGYGVRYLLPSDRPPPPPPPDDGNTNRSRSLLARYVVTAGTIGIFATALTLIIAIAIDGGPQWRETALSIFSSVLPVFATWVGTVLAFYFTNESFKQAAEASQALAGNSGGGEPLTKPGIMIPFETIPKYVMTEADIGRREARVAAADLNLKEKIEPLFAAGTRRVVIFDDKKVPLYVLRRSAMPGVLEPADTLKKYLETGSNMEAAKNFTWTATTASVTDARRTIELRRVTDLFVTEHGRSDEPTIGWVPDENLGRP